MAPATSWIIVCLVTLASGASLPMGKEFESEEQPSIVPSLAPLTKQRHDQLISSRISGTKLQTGAKGEVNDHALEITGSKTLTSADGYVEIGMRGDSRDNIWDGGDCEDNTPTGCREGGNDSQKEHLRHIGYGPDDYYKEYPYYNYAGYGDSKYSREHNFVDIEDGGEKSEEESLHWYGDEVSRSQDTNTGGGFHPCFQDHDEDTDEVVECLHEGECDDEDCDHSEARLTAQFGKEEDKDEDDEKNEDDDVDENEEEDDEDKDEQWDEEEDEDQDEDEVEEEDENEDESDGENEEKERREYMEGLKDDDDDEKDNDNSDDGDDYDDDDDTINDGNDTSLPSFSNLALGPDVSDTPRKYSNNGPDEGELFNVSLYGDEAVQHREYLYHEKTDQSLPIEKGKSVPKEHKTLGEVACIGTERCLGSRGAYEKAGEGDASDASLMDAPVLESTDIRQQDLYFADKTPTIAREDQITYDHISQNELDDILKELEGYIPKENEEWEPAMREEPLSSGWIENTANITEASNRTSRSAKDVTGFSQDFHFKVSGHETVPFEEVYNIIMRSGHINDEGKESIASLEQLRRLVNRLGGLETLLEKPEVHHIVRRQAGGSEACTLLRRRRRRDTGDSGEGQRAVRARRALSNIGRKLEQGNPRLRQLFNQYRTMCDFLSMTVFEK